MCTEEIERTTCGRAELYGPIDALHVPADTHDGRLSAGADVHDIVAAFDTPLPAGTVPEAEGFCAPSRVTDNRPDRYRVPAAKLRPTSSIHDGLGMLRRYMHLRGPLFESAVCATSPC